MRRAHGAFGFPCPYGHEYEPDFYISFNWDIVGGSVGGLCEAYRDKVTKIPGLYSVNLHFDHADEDLEVISPYTNHDVMEILVLRAATVRVRLSDWVDGSKLQVDRANSVDVQVSSDTANSEEGTAVFRTVISGEWLYIYGMGENSRVRITFPMHVETKKYDFRGNIFTFRWRGDAVDAADNLERRLCFFPQI